MANRQPADEVGRGRPKGPKSVSASGVDPPGPPKGLLGKRFEIEDEEFAVLILPTVRTNDVDFGLTPAEREVVRYVLKGFSNEEIAAIRDSSARTVANQLQASYRKLGVGSRLELARKLSE